MVVLPVVTYAVVIVMEILILPLSLLQVGGVNLATLWDRLPLFELFLVMLYGLIVSALWYAPVYGWLLMVSGWARKATFLWATLPPFALAVFEKLAFGTSYVGTTLQHRLAGGGAEAFATTVHEKGTPFSLPQIDLVKFLGSPGLWIGLAIAVVFFFATVRQRRYRGPI